MKYLLLLGLLGSCSSFANFVYMKENAKGKSVQYHVNGTTYAINDTTNKLWALYPDVTPDGNEFVYCEGEAQNALGLTYYNKRQNLTQRFGLKDKGMLLHPKFSKNGKFIFYSAPGKNGKNTIFYFDRAAEVERQGTNLADYSLTDAKAIDESEESYFPRPSSDGNFVVYQKNTPGKKEIVLFDRLENKKTVLAEGMSPSLSFDERLVAYTSKKEGNWNVYTIDRVTKEVKQITSDEHDEMAPTFMTDNTLVFASNKSGNFHLFKTKDSKWEPMFSVEKETDYYAPQFGGDTQYKQGERAPFIGGARSSFGTVSHNGMIYMAGGHQGPEHTYPEESFTDHLIAYDIAKNEWKTLAPRPVKAHGYQIAAFGDYVYAFGGFAFSPDHKPKWKSLDLIHRYSIKENKWELIGKLATPRSSNVAVTIDEKVYLLAGWNSTPKKENDYDGTFLSSVEVFDLKTEKIETAPYSMPTPLRRALTGIEHNGKIVLIGGLGEGATHFELIMNVTSIDPVTGTATEMQPLPFATFAPAAEVLGKELFVFGGMFKTGEWNYEYVSHIYALDLEKKAWRHTGRSLKETKGFSQVFHVDEKTLGILGGHHYFEGQDFPVSTFETFSK